jgi:hypothetical protein
MRDVAMKAANIGFFEYERGCHHKVRYSTEREAKDAARVMHKKHHKKFDAYPCRFCAEFHVGTRTKPRSY